MLQYEILIDEKHLAEGQDRRRKVGLGRYIRGVVKLICLLGLLLLLGICIYGGIWHLTVPISFFIVLLVVAPKADYLLAKRRLKKSPFYNCVATLELTEDGYSHSTPYSKSNAAWSTLRKVRLLSDGFLIFDSNNLSYWWPDADLRIGSKNEVTELLKNKITDYA